MRHQKIKVNQTYTVRNERYIADDEQAVGVNFAAGVTREHKPEIDAFNKNTVLPAKTYTSSEQSRMARTTPCEKLRS
jgi:hypothetical protein